MPRYKWRPQRKWLTKKPFRASWGLSQQQSLVRIFNQHTHIRVRGRAGVRGGVWGRRRGGGGGRQCAARGRGAARPQSPAAAMPPRVTPHDHATIADATIWTPPRTRQRTKLNKFDKSSSYLDHYIDGRVSSDSLHFLLLVQNCISSVERKILVFFIVKVQNNVI